MPVIDWFRPVPAARLAVVRVAIGLFLVATLLGRRAEVLGIASSDPAFFHPVGIAYLLPGPLSVATFAVLQDATIALAILWTLGLAWRATGPLFAAAFLFWATYRLSWGSMVHDLHVVTLHVLILAFTPAAAAISLDAPLARHLPRWPRWAPGPVDGSAHYGWPLRTLSLATTLTYLLAGIAKVKMHSWVSGGNLLQQVAYTALMRRVYHPDQHGTPFIPGWLMSVAAVATIALELGAPLALLGRRPAAVWVAGILAMHLGIALFMDITFPYQTWGLAFLSFVVTDRPRMRYDPRP